MRRIARSLYHIGTILLFVLVAIAGFTQTRAFKGYLLSKALDAVNSAIEGEVTVASLDGNLVTGIRLTDVRGAVAGSTVVTIDRVDISYDVVGALFGSFRISNATLHRPVVQLYRGMDGAWSVSRLIPPASDDTTASSASLAVRRILVQGARIRMTDSLALSVRPQPESARPAWVVDYDDIAIEPLDLVASLTIAPQGIKAEFERLSFTAPAHGLRIRRISGSADIGVRSTSVRNLRIETDRTQLTVTASIAKGLSEISSLDDLAGVRTDLDLKSIRIDFRDLRQFVYPDLEFLDRAAGLEVSASGPFDRLSVDRLTLRTPESFVQLSGTVSNLHRPASLMLDVEGSESVAASDDIRSILPGLGIPSWDRFGVVTFFCSFKGTPGEFDARVYAETERGTIDVDGRFTVGQTLTYKGVVQTEDFDLAGVLGDGTEVSRLNFRMEFDGSGTSIERMIAVAKAEVDSSVVGEIPIRRSVVVLDAADGVFSSHVTGETDAGSLNLSARVGLRDGAVQEYSAQAMFRGLDLHRLTGVASYRSDLNADVELAGRWSDGTQMDSIRVQFSPSQFGQFDIGESFAAIRHTADSSRRSIVVESSPATVLAEGTYALDDLPTLVEYAVSLAEEYVAATFGDLDSLRGFAPQATRGYSPPRDPPAVFARSDVRLTFDFRSLAPLAGLFAVDLDGDARGTIDIAGSPRDYQASGGVQSRRFRVHEPSIDLDGRETRLDFFLERHQPAPGRPKFGAAVVYESGGLSVNGTLFSGNKVRTDVRDSTGIVTVSTEVDSLVRIIGEGRIAFGRPYAELVLDQLRLEANAYTMASPDSFAVAIGGDGFLFRHAHLMAESEELDIAGIFSPGGISDAQFRLKDFLASHLGEILKRTPHAAFLRNVSGRANAELTLQGSLDHPRLVFRMDADGVRVQETVLGQVDVDIDYFEKVLSLFVEVQSASARGSKAPDLLLRGTVPYALALVDVPDEPLEGELDLAVSSPGLDLRFLEPLLVGVTRSMQGTLTCDIRMRGRVEAPRYDGQASIRNARFLFEPTKIEYLLNGDLVADGDRIRLRDVVVRNTPEDLAEGSMKVDGSLQLEGLSLRRFDLGFDGMLRVMKEDSSRLLGAKYYGDLTAATGEIGLTWAGTPDRSLLSGQVNIRNGQITLPPEREVPRFSTRIIDVYRDDTRSAPRGGSAGIPASFAGGPATGGTAAEEQSFVDRIDFDLTLQTQGTTQLRFIFNRQANDVLFADLRGRLSFLRNPSSTRLNGEVEVTERSYYNFLKRFTASGRLLFTGDPLNPELDITARYEGIHKKRQDGASSQPDDAGAQATVDERTTVVLYLTGPRNKLETKFDVEVETPEGRIQRTGDVEADAIAFIMTGQFRDELTEQDRSSLLTQNLGYGLASGLLTGPLSETLRRTTKGSIQSLDVIYYGGGGQLASGTDVRVTGQFGDAIYRVGGRVFNDLANTNLVVELPMSWVLNTDKLRNLILTLERRVEGIEVIEDQRRASNEARLLYRISF